MAQCQVRTMPINIPECKIRSAIDLLLSSNSVKVEEPTVNITICSPDVDVVINKQGGICTRCNSMFKSRISLINHIQSCIGSTDVLYGMEDQLDQVDNSRENESEVSPGPIKLKIKTNSPKLNILSN